MDIGKKRYIVLGLLCAIYILSFFHRLCPAVIALDLSNELHVTPADIGFLSGSTMLIYGLMQLPSGLLADALGGKRAVVLLSVLAGIATLWFASTESFNQMIAARFVLGMALAVTVPALALLAVWFPPHMYARASSLLLCCGGLGAILAAPPLAALSDAFGWRPALIFFGVLTLAVAAVIAFCLDTPPMEIQKKKTTLAGLLLGVKHVLATKRFWPMALWHMCLGGTYFALAGLWWGPYLMQGCGLNKMEASMALTAGSLTILVAQPIMGALSDTVFRSRKKPVMVLSFFSMFTSMGFVLLTGTITVWIMAIQAAAFLFTIAAGTPLIFTMVKETFPLEVVGTATGCLNMFYPVWAAIIQRIYGFVLEMEATASAAVQFSAASWVVVAHCVMAFILCLFMKETWKAEE